MQGQTGLKARLKNVEPEDQDNDDGVDCHAAENDDVCDAFSRFRHVQNVSVMQIVSLDFNQGSKPEIRRN
jgi:hypothetical protein